MSDERPAKSASAFRTISEVANELGVAQHVLRFWESKFQQVKPLKRGGGRRYYRPEDVEILKEIVSLLHGEGYTIKGAQKLLRQKRSPALKEPPAKQPVEPKAQIVQPPTRTKPTTTKSDELARVVDELKDMRAQLGALLDETS